MKTFVLLITMAMFAVPAIAETYEWEDDQGTVNFTEDLGNIPKKYRKKARIVGGEEPSPAEVRAGNGKPAVQQQTESNPAGAAQGDKGGASAAKPDMKAVYGGKDAQAWKSELAAIKVELRGTEGLLVEQRKQLKDTSTMSRTQYLSIQKTIKSIEHSVLGLRRKLDDLKKEAQTVGVPAELME